MNFQKIGVFLALLTITLCVVVGVIDMFEGGRTQWYEVVIGVMLLIVFFGRK